MSNNLIKILILTTAVFLFGVFGIASGAFNEQINYQGKLTDSSDITVADGAYDMIFKLYTGAEGGSAIYTEDWNNDTPSTFASTINDVSPPLTSDSYPLVFTYTDHASESTLAVGQILYNLTKKDSVNITAIDTTANTITISKVSVNWANSDSITTRPMVKNGLFSVMIGTLVSLSSIDFNQDLWLGVTIENDSEMTPRKKIGAVPAAFESKQLGGKAETAFGTLSESEAVIGAWTFSDLLTVTEVPTGALVNQGSLYVNPATATADYTLLGLAVGGAEKFRVDEDGDVVIEGDVSFTGSQTISTTAGDLVLNPTGNLALSSNSITGLGTGITASGALTITTTGANNLTLTPGTGLTTTGSTFQITGGLLDVDTYTDIAYSDAAIAALTVAQSGTGGIVDFKDGANSVFTVADGGNAAIANISAVAGSAFSVTRNLASGSTDSAIVSFIQSNASDDQPNLSLTNAGTGNSFSIDQNGNVGTTISTDGALFVENTGNTGIGLNAYTNIGATADASLIYFTTDNDAFDQEVLTVRQDGTGAIASLTNTATATSDAFTISNLGTGNAITIDQDGNVGTTVSTDGALFVENTGNTDIGLNVYSNIGATSAAGLVYFTADNTGFDQTVLTIGQDGTGNILDIQKSGSSVFEVTQSLVKVSQPLQVNVAGDVGFSRSVEFTSTGESHIYSEGPFTIAAGDPNSAENLTLTTRTTEESPETGDVTTGAASYIIDTGQTSWVNDEFVGGRIEITAGPGLGEIKEICANVASDDDKITVCSNFTTTPTTASDYSVYRKAGDILVNISGTNLTSGGFKVLGMESTIFRIDTEGDVFIGGNGRMGSDLTVKQNISLTGGNIAVGHLDISSAGTPSTSISSTSGGSCLSTGTYYYKITALNDNGETIGSTEGSQAMSGAANDEKITITWSAVSGATKYKVHRSVDQTWDAGANDHWVDGDYTYAPTAIIIDDCSGDTASDAPPSVNTTGGNITYPSTDGPKRSIILTAAGGTPPTSNGAAQTKIDGTNHTYYVLDFDATTDESVFWHWTMPDSYDNGTIDITYYWEAAATAGEVGWCFQAKGIQANNTEDIDSALSSAVCEVDTAQGNANDLASVTESAVASNFAAGEYAAFKVFRDADQSTVGAGNDDMAGDARLVKVKIEYSVSSESD